MLTEASGNMEERCPCCQRPLEKMVDYPIVLVRRVEILGIPEVIDYLSEEAASARLKAGQVTEHGGLVGINRTPEIAEAYESEIVQGYLRSLEHRQGQEVPSAELVPHLEPDSRFRHAYPLPGTRLYLSLLESTPEGTERASRVVLYGQGPNLGSAGGPTLQELGSIAVIRYEGRLLDAGEGKQR